MSSAPDKRELTEAEKHQKVVDLGKTIERLREQLNKDDPTGTKNNWAISVQLQKTKARREALMRSMSGLRLVEI